VVATISNGVTVPELHLLSARERDGALMLARICPEKGTHIGIAAAKKAGVMLKIGGRVFPYPAHVNYFSSRVAPELSEQVRFLGPVGYRQKIELLRSASCLLVPSTVPETSSLVSMEALACGTPVIALHSGSLPHIVEHGKTGFIVNSADEMAEAIRRVGEIDPEVCRRVAIQQFSAERMVGEYLNLYERLAAGNDRALKANAWRSECQSETSQSF